jgi:hypothetical protein
MACSAPAGHPAINELWVALQRDLGAEAEPLHHAGPKPFEHHVGAFEELQARFDGGGGF